MGKTKFTTDTFSQIVTTKSNGSIKLIGEYINISTPVMFECTKGHRYLQKPNRFQCGDRCPFCGGHGKFTIKDVLKELEERYPTCEILADKFINNDTPLRLKCKICGNDEIYVKRRKYRKHPCPCQLKNNRYTDKTFSDKFYKIHNDLILLEDYTTRELKKSILCKCKIHNYTWRAGTVHIVNSRKPTGCPVCKSSKGEKKIYDYLSELKVNFIFQKSYDELIGERYPLKFDFCIIIDGKETLIEYDGEFHEKQFSSDYEKFNRLKLNDSRKNKWCLENNKKLVRIHYTEFDQIKIIIDELIKV
jgi:hypothetical protein